MRVFGRTEEHYRKVEKCALPYQYAGWIRKGGVEKKAKNIVYLIKCTGVNEVMLQMN